MNTVWIKKDLIWCPSQIYIFMVKEDCHQYQAYARWRHSDPWTFRLASHWGNPYENYSCAMDLNYTEHDDIDTIIDDMKLTAIGMIESGEFMDESILEFQESLKPKP